MDHDAQTGCYMTVALEVVGGKWKGVILFHLGQGTHRFNELMRRMPCITQRMLTRQLRELEADGVISRVVYAQVPPKVEYSLTDLGKTLLPIVGALTEWGAMFDRLAKERNRA